MKRNYRHRESTGSVLMEYVIVTFFTALFLVGVGRIAFRVPSSGDPQYNLFVLPQTYTSSLGDRKYYIDPESGEITVAAERNYGMLGDAFLSQIRTIQRVISSPLP